LVHPFRTRQVPQPDCAEISQDDLFRKLINAQITHNTRQERLTRVSDISKLTASASDQTFGIRVTGPRFTGMEAYSRLEYGSLGGRVGDDRQLHVESKSQRILCTVEACDKVLIMPDV
jgi:hypothetical protein